MTGKSPGKIWEFVRFPLRSGFAGSLVFFSKVNFGCVLENCETQGKNFFLYFWDCK